MNVLLGEAKTQTSCILAPTCRQINKPPQQCVYNELVCVGFFFWSLHCQNTLQLSKQTTISCKVSALSREQKGSDRKNLRVRVCVHIVQAQQVCTAVLTRT